MPLHSDDEPLWLRALESFDHAIFWANRGDYKFLSRVVDSLMVARIDIKSRRFLADPTHQSRET